MKPLLPLASTLSMLAILAAPPAYSDDGALLARIEALERQLQALKQEVAKADHKAEEATARTDALAAQQETATGAAIAGKPGSQTSLFGYGEIAYSRPRRAAAQTQVDVSRAVFGIGHRFNERLKFVSEFEFEHAIASADDAGEAEVEQFYVDYALGDRANVKAGLFLIPIGLLNESHEPTRYYGVFRNDVETRIIPTTWREVGIGLHGTLDAGIAYDMGLTSGFSMHKWNAEESPGAPLASIHQEGQFAAARNIAYYGALHYVGVPGLRIGGALWTGNSSQGNGPFQAGASSIDLSGIKGRITLASLDATYTAGNLDLRALYATGRIGQARQIDDALVAPAVGFTGGFVPAKFDGGYLQAGYRLWERGDLTLAPFVRWERYNTQKTMPSGYESFADSRNNEHVTTLGASLFVTQNVVFKADYQKYRSDPNRDRVNLGIGLEF
jgi:hypothetical protein